MTLARIGAMTIVALLAVATVFGGLTVAVRLLRRVVHRRRTRLAAPARRLLVRLTAGGDDPDLIEALAAVDPSAWRAVEPAAVAMLGKVRGEAHAALVGVFRRRGAAVRAVRDLRARSAVRRARAAEVLGNLGETDAVPALCALLDDREPAVRVVAARSLGRVADPGAAQPLLHAVVGRHPVPPQLIAHAVVRLGLAAQGEVAGALEHPDELVRATAMEVLGLIGAVATAARVEVALRSDRSAEVRLRAARTLGRLGTRSALQPLLETVEPDRPTALRAVAAQALGELGSPAAAPALATLIADPQYLVANRAARALLRLGAAGAAVLEAAAAADQVGRRDKVLARSVVELRTGAARAAAHAREAMALAELDESRRGMRATAGLVTVGP
jgi:HEAT repeat protein